MYRAENFEMSEWVRCQRLGIWSATTEHNRPEDDRQPIQCSDSMVNPCGKLLRKGLDSSLRSSTGYQGRRTGGLKADGQGVPSKSIHAQFGARACLDEDTTVRCRVHEAARYRLTGVAVVVMGFYLAGCTVLLWVHKSQRTSQRSSSRRRANSFPRPSGKL